jgi:argininosuccinate lyase
MMTSKVSGMLKEPLDPIIQSEMLAPNLIRDFPAALPLITQINKAHVLMLRQQEILTSEQAQRLALAILDLEAAGGPTGKRLLQEQTLVLTGADPSY